MQNTPECDVLIIGAGPAGCAAAQALACAGRRVLLVDRCHFPRDKVCGDGLISDAIAALDELGIRTRVLAEAVTMDELRLYTPNGTFIPLRGHFACLDRTRLDALLLQAATDAGATFLDGLEVAGSLRAGDRVAGASFDTASGPVDIRARLTLLATGANTVALNAFGLGVPTRATAVAGRAYFEAPPALAGTIRHLTIAYSRGWCPGYGWVFPGPGNRFNIGVGLFPQDGRGHRLRTFWQWFTTAFEPAAAIVRASLQCTPFRGAPLRTGLTPERFGLPGLLVVGEAAAVTYPATGEGIGKAMESGLLAASLVNDAWTTGAEDTHLHAVYGREFHRRHLARYRAYRVAQRWAAHPLVLNLLASRANAGRFVRRELEALVDERGEAGDLFSTRGLLTALVQ